MGKKSLNLAIFLAITAVVTAAAPASAHEHPMACSGTILLPSLPALLVHAHNSGLRGNDALGVVCDLPRHADDGSYKLTRTTPGPANLDVYFYEDDDGKPGKSCRTIDSDDSEPFIKDPAPVGGLLVYVDAREEEGRICPGEQEGRWAVIVLRTGVFHSFEFEWRPGRRPGQRSD